MEVSWFRAKYKFVNWVNCPISVGMEVSELTPKINNSDLDYTGKQYWRETLTELAKVTWPSKDEVVGSTIVTVIVSLIMGFFIFTVDMGLSQAMRVVLGF